MRRPRLMWDLFCGLGGASAAFRAAGWRVLTVDVEPLFKPDILIDVRDFDPRGLETPDFLWASPPCVEYASRRFKPDLQPSPELVIQARRVIGLSGVKLWALENVRHSVPFINEVLGPFRQSVGAWFLWGTFPRFLPSPVGVKGSPRGPHWLRSATRAKIPLSLSEDVERAVTYLLDAQEARARAAAPSVADPSEAAA